LTARGFSQPDEVNEFMADELKRLPSPKAMPGLSDAVKYLLKARKDQAIVGVAGDYDADGLTATTLLAKALTAFGYKVVLRIPNRLTEGYGLSPKAVDDLIAQGAGLIVTVDCGVSDLAAVDRAKQAGVPVVVTDHHRLPPLLPGAGAIVNPHLGGEWEKHPPAGVGVAFILALGLKNALAEEGVTFPEFSLVESLSLVALGSIADLVSLKGPNRILVRHGLKFLARVNWPGLSALRGKAMKKQDFVSVRDVGFRLAPRLNAAGRLGQAEVALKLLMSEDVKEAKALAEELETLNRTRLRDQSVLMEDAFEALEDEDLAGAEKRTVVLAGENWPKGLLGLVASRVVESTQRPTVIFSVEGDLAVGSGRSTPGFNLFEALEPLRDMCLSMGGHSMAAGIKLKVKDLPRFKAGFEKAARRQAPPESEASLDVDLVLDLADLAVVGPILAELEPFGPSHPAPVAVLKNAIVLEAAPTRTGGDHHINLRLYDGGERISLVGFGLAPRLHEIGKRLDVAVELDTDRFGRREANWRLLDFKAPQRVA
jgi:single-stranded-DNA-specific exonuclease